MDTTPIARAMAPAQPSAPQPQTVSVATEVPAVKAVPAAVELDLTDIDTLRHRAGLEATLEQGRRERGFELDKDNNALVFRVSDPESGAVVFQMPSDEALKLRAYNREQLDEIEHERDVKA
jgi:hypothetical protein